jgi:outer membrane receptor protein involved in Fe transport
MLNKVTVRATFIAVCTMISASAYAMADTPKSVDIPAGDLSAALLKLAKQSGVELVYRPEQIYGVKTRGAHGALTNEQAVTKLLYGTKLELRTDPSGAMLIAPTSPESTLAPDGARATATATGAAGSGDKEGKNNSSNEFLVAQANQGPPSAAASVGNSAQESQRASDQLQEVIVTAEKKNESLMEVPVPVTAIQASTLIENNQPTLSDFYSNIPSLNIQPRIQSGDNIVIRGISTGGFSNPTVGITVDGVPYGSSTELGGGLLIPDIDPGDLSRIEVLRGPQGTLYGASSMGGLINYVTVDPSIKGFSGTVQAGIDGDQHGNDPGFNFRGSLNVPLTDDLAVRVSAFTRLDPGYIENPALNVTGVNQDRASGGHLAALWQPSENLSLKVSAFYQDTKADGSNDVFTLPGFGDLQQNYAAGVGGGDKKAQGYSATLTALVGSATISSITGYNVNQFSDSFDLTYLFGASGVAPTTPYTITGDGVFESNKTEKVTEELRVSAPIGESFEIFGGGFFTHETSNLYQAAPETDPVSGAVVAERGFGSFGLTYKEYAAYVDLTYHITDQFDVQAGARESRIEQGYAEVSTASVFTTAPIDIINANSTADAFTYLLTPRFKITPDVMLYARLASGYRAGGPNPAAGGIVPNQYNPDKTKTYEVGLKGEFDDHKLSIDTSLYYIDWTQIQISLVNPADFRGYTLNGGGAKSEGAELSIEYRPVTGLTLGTWVAGDNAVLTSDFPNQAGDGAYGVSGNQLPNSSKWSGNLSARQEFPITNAFVGFVSAVGAYVGERVGIFEATPVRQDYPSYTKLDLRTGINGDSWTINLYVNNVTDKRGVVSGGLGQYPPFAFQIIPPRLFGLSVSKSF